jgi:hypothetical protein
VYNARNPMDLRRSVVLLALLSIAALAPPAALGSEIIGRDVSRPTLAIDHRGHAHVSYISGGRRTVLVASGAINARAPSTSRPQVKFRIRYGEGGSGVCLPYDGPPLAWLVKACKAPDGSYWALQSWQRLKPNYGGTRGPAELHLSHWRGALPQLVVYQNWAEHRYRHLFGRLTYRGRGVYGFKATPSGSPLDSYGRNVYVDTFDSAYGKGWHRENSFLTHHRGHTLGDFCYGFFPHSGHPSGQGSKYRATAEGPGVTPVVMWAANDIGPFDQTVQTQMQALERSWGDPKCRT